jgi:hypothetical protein
MIIGRTLIHLSQKALVRFKQQVRELTWRTRGVSLEARVAELRTYLRGWQASLMGKTDD